jgi:SAM-dependent methyltransferase
MRFDVCAHTYDEHAGPQRFFAELVAEFIGAKPPETVVEFGAGTGALTRWLESEFVHATDASPAMVKWGCLAVPKAQWSVLDAFNQSPPVASLQISSGLLHWAEDPVATLFRWKQSLAPGGRMVHAIPCEPCLTEWRALVPESPVPWRGEAEWLSLFKQAGLRVARSQCWIHQAICASALEMVHGFHRTGVTGRVRVGPGRLRQALREYDRRHLTGTGVKATWVWLAIEAVAV